MLVWIAPSKNASPPGVPGGSVAPVAQIDIDDVAVLVNRPIQIMPALSDLKVSLGCAEL